MKRIILATFFTLSVGLPSSRADVYNSRYSFFQESSTPSIIAAHVMGARGFGNYTPPTGMDWRTELLVACERATTAARGGRSLWTGGCDPTGMAVAMSNLANPQQWVVVPFDNTVTDQQKALDKTVYGLASSSLRSPAVVPIFGQADHWVTIYGANATPLGGDRYALNSVTFYDALQAPDANSNDPFRGSMTFAGGTWKRMFFLVVNAINASCDPHCTSDPFHNKYLVTYDPPPDGPSLRTADSGPAAHFSPITAPGIVGASERMSSELAQRGVLQALHQAQIDKSAPAYAAVTSGHAGSARLIEGFDPSGEPWHYYLVPIHNGAGAVSSFVELSARDGAFEGTMVFEKPIDWLPIEPEAAVQLARKELVGNEQLGDSTLSWNPAVSDLRTRSPHLPFYEFSVLDQSGAVQGAILITLHGGHAIRRPARRTQ